MGKFLTIGLAAVRIGGVQSHQLRRLADSGRIPVTLAGRIRLIAIADLPAIRKACVEAGYLPDDAAVAGGTNAR